MIAPVILGIEVKEEAIALIEQQQLQFERVLSLSEYELLDVARIRARFGISGYTFAQVERVRNKLIMKRMVEAAGIRVPQFLPLSIETRGTSSSVG